MNNIIPHTNPAYDREMLKMTQLLREMESALREQLTNIEAAFADMDLARAQTVWHNDSRLNDMEGKALKQAIAVLACYQPVAEDLRKVVGVLYTATEYERIGDYIKNFAKSVEAFVSRGETLKIFPLLLAMMRDVRKQFDAFLEAHTADDLDAAIDIWRNDKTIDVIFHNIINIAADNQNAGDGNAHSLINAISVASNLERLGDRIKNLVEIFHYRKTGQQIDTSL